MKYRDFFENSFLDEIFNERRENFENELIKATSKDKSGNSAIYKEVIIEDELIDLVKNLIKDQSIVSILVKKINEYAEENSSDLDYWTRKYYKLGFCDSMKLKDEINASEQNTTFESFLNENDQSFREYFEDYRKIKLNTKEEFNEIEDKKRKVYEEYPTIRELFENEKAKGFSNEEMEAINEILRLESMQSNLEIKEAFKLGIKEAYIFLKEQDMLKI